MVAGLDNLKKPYVVPNFRIGGKYDLATPAKWQNGGEGGVTLESLGAAPARPAYFLADVDELDPFVAALRRIEQEGGRGIQAQIRLLKDGEVGLEPGECEAIVATKQAAVDAVFTRFLEWLAGERIEMPVASMPFTPAIAGGYACRS